MRAHAWSRRALWVGMALVLSAGGCSDDDSGELVGDVLIVRDCKDGADFVFNPYEMRPDFFAVEQLGDISFVRMQEGGKPLYRTDALVIEVGDIDFVRERRGMPIPIDNPNVRATLSVLGSCPSNTQSMTAHDGHITFEHIGTAAGDRVAASFAFQLVDDRTGELVGINFRGKLDFTVKVGQPYQPFAGQ